MSFIITNTVIIADPAQRHHRPHATELRLLRGETRRKS